MSSGLMVEKWVSVLEGQFVGSMQKASDFPLQSSRPLVLQKLNNAPSAGSSALSTSPVRGKGTKRKLHSLMDKMESTLATAEGVGKPWDSRVKKLRRRVQTIESGIQKLKRQTTPLSPNSREEQVELKATTKLQLDGSDHDYEIQELELDIRKLQAQIDERTSMDTSPVDAEELEQQDTDTTARLETIQLEIEQKKENIRVLEQRIDEAKAAVEAAAVTPESPQPQSQPDTPDWDSVRAELKATQASLHAQIAEQAKAKQLILREDPSVKDAQEQIDDLCTSVPRAKAMLAPHEAALQATRRVFGQVVDFHASKQQPFALALQILQKEGGRTSMSDLKKQMAARVPAQLKSKVLSTVYGVMGKGLAELDRSDPTCTVVEAKWLASAATE